MTSKFNLKILEWDEKLQTNKQNIWSQIEQCPWILCYTLQIMQLIVITETVTNGYYIIIVTSFWIMKIIAYNEISFLKNLCMFGISLRNKNRLAGVLITPIGSIGVCKIEEKKEENYLSHCFANSGMYFKINMGFCDCFLSSSGSTGQNGHHIFVNCLLEVWKSLLFWVFNSCEQRFHYWYRNEAPMYIDKIKCLDTLEKFKFSINFMFKGSVKYFFVVGCLCLNNTRFFSEWWFWPCLLVI